MPYTYNTYFYTEVFSGVLFSGLAVAGFIIYAFLPCCCSEDKDGNLRKSTRVLYPFIKKHEESNETIIFGYVLEKWYIVWLFIVAQIIVGVTMFILGFNLFVINSSVCSTGYDCFANKTPIVNCSSDEDVECFQLTCNIGNAVGAATGAQLFAMAAANIIMRTILYFASKVVSIKNVYDNPNTPLKKVVDKHKAKARKICGIIGIISCQIVTGVIFVSVVTAAALVQAVVPLENVSLSFGCVLELFLLCIALAVSCLVFWCFGFKRTSRQEVMQNLQTTCSSLQTIEGDLQKAKDSLQKAKESLENIKQQDEQEIEAHRKAARMSLTTALLRLSKIQRDSEQACLKLPSAQQDLKKFMEQQHRELINIDILEQTKNWIQQTKQNINEAMDEALNINEEVHVPIAIDKIQGALSAITEKLQVISTNYNRD